MKSTKTMLIAALAAGALLIGSSSLRAGALTNTPPAGEHGHGKGRMNIAKELNLTDAQKPKFQEILKSATDKRKALREDTGLTPEEKKAKGKTLLEDTATQMKAVLTPEQFTKWEELTKKTRRNGLAAGSMTPKAAPQP